MSSGALKWLILNINKVIGIFFVNVRYMRIKIQVVKFTKTTGFVNVILDVVDFILQKPFLSCVANPRTCFSLRDEYELVLVLEAPQEALE
jgi:hypothetical protein